MKNICIYCGSKHGKNEKYSVIAVELAEKLAENNINIVYGGSNIGLMGKIANAALNKGGEVIGIIPKFLVDKEIAHNGLTELIIADSMHERKQIMESHSDAFVALPGGLGTVEEIIEMIAWAKLKLHSKPCAFLNINGYYNSLFNFLDNMVNEGFLDKKIKDMIIIEDDMNRLIKKLQLK